MVKNLIKTLIKTKSSIFPMSIPTSAILVTFPTSISGMIPASFLKSRLKSYHGSMSTFCRGLGSDYNRIKAIGRFFLSSVNAASHYQTSIISFLASLLLLFYTPQTITAQEKNSDPKDSLKLSGRIQPRMVSGQQESGFSDGKSDFKAIDMNFRRIRIGAAYNSGDWYGGKIELKGESFLTKASGSSTEITYVEADTDGATASPPQDQIVVTKVNGKSALQEANIWAKLPFDGSRIYMGQFKIPFLREHRTSSGSLIIPERSFAADTLQQQDIGLMISTKPVKNLVSFDLSLTNGDGAGDAGVGNKQAETDDSVIASLYNWRIDITPFGGIGKKNEWKEGDEIFQNDLKLAVGLAGAYSQAHEYSSSYLLASKDADNKEDLIAHTIDFTFTTAGFYLGGAFSMMGGSAAYDKLQTYQATLGYNFNLGPIYLMPALRFDHIQADFDKSDKIEDHEKFNKIWLGANIFAVKHTLKGQLFYEISQDKAGIDSNGKSYDLKDNMLYFMVTYSFSKTL